MKNHFGRFTFILLLAATCAWLFFEKGIKLGLDLAGGSSVTYTVRTEGDPDRKKLDRAIEVITKRINATGLTEIFITSTAAGEIVVEMPRRTKDEINTIKSLIERNGQLEFRMREELGDETKERQLRDASPAGMYKVPPDRRWIDLSPKEIRPGGPKDALVKVPEVPLEKKLAELRATKGDDAPETKQAARELQDVLAAEVFRGEDLDQVGLTRQGAQTVVAFELKDHRKADFTRFTSRNVGKQMAIILDARMNSDPVIRSELPGHGVIEGGGAGFQYEEANELRITLESGSTGVKLELDREESLGASLGEVAVERGTYSVIVGFAAVLLAMVWYYRVPGLVACFALFMNLLITLGALAFFRAALSLPGIAGMVLGLGMSIDANILIFERLRDERKRGRSLQESLAAGYDNAMSAIIDGNITALLSALVLIWLGSGSVRGFGVTLAIGLLASMFTAVWVTRCIFEWALDRKILREFDIGKDPHQPSMDFMGLRRLFTIPSIALMAAGVVGFLVRDDESSKDLEFIGGQQVVVQMTKPVTADEMQRVIKGPEDRWEDATAIALEPEGVAAQGGGTNRWQIRAKATSEAKGKEYVEYLRKELGGSLVAQGFSDWTPIAAGADGKKRLAVTMHTLAPVSDVEEFTATLRGKQLGEPKVEPVADDPKSLRITVDAVDDADTAAGAPVVQERIRKVVESLQKPVHLSEPMPSVTFLSPIQAEKQWRVALQAVLVSLLFQVLYIRVRFADYTHGFAAAIALIHDVTVTLGAVALFDYLELVYAKVNLVLIAAFLTLIGYSMNDTIVIFDRIRENLGRSKTIRAQMINDATNQTFSRSIRTSIIVFLTVVAQFLFNRNLGSSIEGFAFVMTVGVVAGSYSTYFIASPILLFLPGYGRRLFAKRPLFLGLCLATLVGVGVSWNAAGHDTQFWIGAVLAAVIPLHFLAHFVPWLGHPDPDSLVVVEDSAASEEPPLQAPGV
jgi:SecD/SecF fusion protein